jgi:hypothetical protein
LIANNVQLLSKEMAPLFSAEDVAKIKKFSRQKTTVKLMMDSFIGGGNWSALRKPLTCRKLLTNFIT